MKFCGLLIGLGLICGSVNSFSDSQERWLEKVEEYQHKVKLIVVNDTTKNRNFVKAYLDTATFNIGYYLSLYDQLRIKENWLADYANWYSWDAGIPLLFARNIGMNFDSILDESVKRNHHYLDSALVIRLKQIEEDSLSRNKARRIQERKDAYRRMKWDREGAKVAFANDSLRRLERYLIPEDTPTGYFQLVTFHVIGNNFGLYWHSFYSFHFIIYKKEHIEKLLEANRQEDFLVNFDANEVEQFLEKDLKPKIQMEAERCCVTLYTFYTTGIYKTTWSVMRKPPYTVKCEKKENVVKNETRGFY